ncbi:Ppx/GppA phosphatase family protein [Ensifer soli]|uniref:Ppx/GppA phosphatase family protein n=1 Tax=Ciceribacter sp. sgz301302 TaxID=3342379 RepID=UPI0035B9A111
MNDPDHGGKPSASGAPAAGRGEGQALPRQGKGKRRRRKPPASRSASSASAGVSGEARRPDTVEASDAMRKRKRRRRGKGANRPEMSAAAVRTEVVPAGAAEAGGLEAAPPPSRKPSLHRPSKPAQHGRALQGRPLASGRPEQAKDGRAASDRARGDRASAPAPKQDASHRPLEGQQQGEAGPPRFPGRPAGEGRNFRVAPQDDRQLYAALDLGTNNCRLLIAQPGRPGSFRVVDAFSRIVRLGEGLAATGALSPEAIQRSIEALKICAAKLKSHNIRRHRLIATEAARAAVNGEDFLRRVFSETGLELEIIDRETEARLAVSGCSSLVGRETRSLVLFDIGGGSSEIAVLDIGTSRSNRLANHITHWTSLPVGVVTLSERHGGRDVTPENFAAMVAEVEGMLDRFACPPVDALARHGNGFYLIGTSGTVTTLAGVHLDLPRYDRRKVDGIWLSDAEVSAMQARLLSWNFAERAANPCIGPDRADLVLAGCAILEAIRRRWPSERLRVADRGLREGLLTDMMADDGVWRRGRPRHDDGPRGERR